MAKEAMLAFPDDFPLSWQPMAVWEVHHAPEDGALYYHNRETDELSWVKPPELEETPLARVHAASHDVSEIEDAVIAAIKEERLRKAHIHGETTTFNPNFSASLRLLLSNSIQFFETPNGCDAFVARRFEVPRCTSQEIAKLVKADPELTHCRAGAHRDDVCFGVAAQCCPFPTGEVVNVIVVKAWRRNMQRAMANLLERRAARSMRGSEQAKDTKWNEFEAAVCREYSGIRCATGLDTGLWPEALSLELLHARAPEAGKPWNVPLSPFMTHSFVESHTFDSSIDPDQALAQILEEGIMSSSLVHTVKEPLLAVACYEKMVKSGASSSGNYQRVVRICIQFHKRKNPILKLFLESFNRGGLISEAVFFSNGAYVATMNDLPLVYALSTSDLQSGNIDLDVPASEPVASTVLLHSDNESDEDTASKNLSMLNQDLDKHLEMLKARLASPKSDAASTVHMDDEVPPLSIDVEKSPAKATTKAARLASAAEVMRNDPTVVAVDGMRDVFNSLDQLHERVAHLLSAGVDDCVGLEELTSNEKPPDFPVNTPSGQGEVRHDKLTSSPSPQVVVKEAFGLEVLLGDWNEVHLGVRSFLSQQEVRDLYFKMHRLSERKSYLQLKMKRLWFASVERVKSFEDIGIIEDPQNSSELSGAIVAMCPAYADLTSLLRKNPEYIAKLGLVLPDMEASRLGEIAVSSLFGYGTMGNSDTELISLFDALIPAHIDMLEKTRVAAVEWRDICHCLPGALAEITKRGSMDSYNTMLAKTVVGVVAKDNALASLGASRREDTIISKTPVPDLDFQQLYATAVNGNQSSAAPQHTPTLLESTIEEILKCVYESVSSIPRVVCAVCQKLFILGDGVESRMGAFILKDFLFGSILLPILCCPAKFIGPYAGSDEVSRMQTIAKALDFLIYRTNSLESLELGLSQQFVALQRDNIEAILNLVLESCAREADPDPPTDFEDVSPVRVAISLQELSFLHRTLYDNESQLSSRFDSMLSHVLRRLGGDVPAVRERDGFTEDVVLQFQVAKERTDKIATLLDTDKYERLYCLVKKADGLLMGKLGEDAGTYTAEDISREFQAAKEDIARALKEIATLSHTVTILDKTNAHLQGLCHSAQAVAQAMLLQALNPARMPSMDLS